MSIGFGSYLKDYLEFHNISQTEFANRLNISQKHMNEILNEKQTVTLEMTASIYHLTGIPIEFIIKAECRKYITDKLIEEYGNLNELNKYLKKNYYLKELEERNWIKFNNKTNAVQNYIDLMDFLKVKDFEALEKIKEKTLFKKTGNDLNKLNLWIARCNEMTKNQTVSVYDKDNFLFLIDDLKTESYKKGIDLEKIKVLLNSYGIYFIVEKALSGTKVRGCFRVKGKNPAIYLTKNYSSKDSFYFELFHELGHCKSDFNEAKSKVIVEGTDLLEKRADDFALKTMISDNVWNEIIGNASEKNCLQISRKYKIPMSFIVGRLAKFKIIEYDGEFYNEYKMD